MNYNSICLEAKPDDFGEPYCCQDRIETTSLRVNGGPFLCERRPKIQQIGLSEATDDISERSIEESAVVFEPD